MIKRFIEKDNMSMDSFTGWSCDHPSLKNHKVYVLPWEFGGDEHLEVWMTRKDTGLMMRVGFIDRKEFEEADKDEFVTEAFEMGIEPFNWAIDALDERYEMDIEEAEEEDEDDEDSEGCVFCGIRKGIEGFGWTVYEDEEPEEEDPEEEDPEDKAPEDEAPEDEK